MVHLPVFSAVRYIITAKFVPSYYMKILACGSNGNFQLGTGDSEDHDVLQEIRFSPPVTCKPKQFALGGNHTLILFENGEVYASGNNEYGQCGVLGPPTLQKFTKIPGNWNLIAAGWEFSILVDTCGHLYSCGNGPKGELGRGKDQPRGETLKIASCGEFTEVQASINHVIARTSTGELYGWGNCRKGQMGPVATITKGKPVACLWEPMKLLISCPQYAMGHDRTILIEKHRVKVIGKNAEEMDNELEIRKSRAMWSSVHTGVSTENGMLIHSTGNNLHGQLFEYLAPGKIIDFEVGSEHGVVLLEDNTVHAWGWGEHGNCGKQATKECGTHRANHCGEQKAKDVTFAYLNQIYTGSGKVCLLACGCATTWVVTE